MARPHIICIKGLRWLDSELVVTWVHSITPLDFFYNILLQKIFRIITLMVMQYMVMHNCKPLFLSMKSFPAGHKSPAKVGPQQPRLPPVPILFIELYKTYCKISCEIHIY